MGQKHSEGRETEVSIAKNKFNLKATIFGMRWGREPVRSVYLCECVNACPVSHSIEWLKDETGFRLPSLDMGFPFNR